MFVVVNSSPLSGPDRQQQQTLPFTDRLGESDNTHEIHISRLQLSNDSLQSVETRRSLVCTLVSVRFVRC